MDRYLKELSSGMWNSKIDLLDHKLWPVKDEALKSKNMQS